MNVFHIMYVDDNVQLLSVVKQGLTRYGFDVTTASDGSDALLQFESHTEKFGAIVTDNEMPHMNGLEFVQAVRGIGFEGRILVVSGNFKPGDLEAYQDSAISGFLQKPFDLRLLAAMLLKKDCPLPQLPNNC